METLKKTIGQVRADLLQALTNVTNDQELENVRIAYLGRKGQLSLLMEALKKLSLEEKKHVGPLLNTLKNDAEQAFNDKKKFLAEQQEKALLEQKQHFDVTAYKRQELQGSLHIYTHIQEELENIFISMGYAIADGPEIDTDFYNFEALNIPADHPARDMQDTFWLTLPGYLMRTQTSTIQIHTMQTQQPPIAVIAPGRVYRNEATDASHDFMFTQLEALLVDKNVSISNLIATAKTFLNAVFNKKDLAIRVRPGYFPFVEPGIEIDLACPFCKQGCSVCKKTTWIELLGAGLVHPNVLRHCGINPAQYTGFALGMGIERLAMVKYGINDIRLFHGSSIDFLQQFP